MPTRKSLSSLLRDADGNLIEAPATGTQPPASPVGGDGTGQLASTPSPAAASTSPAEAAAQGAGVDAAKMAGTPASGGAAPGLGAPTQSQQSGAGKPTLLRDQERLQQSGAAGPDPREQRRMQEAERMRQQLGDLGTRVQDVISRATYLQAPPPGQPGAPAAAGLVTGDTSGLSADQKAKLDAVLASNGSPESIAAAMQAGIPNPKSYFTVGADGSFSYTDAASKQLAAAAQDSLKLTPEALKQMGYADPAAFAQTLGLAPEQLAGMTLQDVQAQVQQRLQQEYTRTEELKRAASDPAAGPNERAAAREALRASGATGVYATEADMKRLSDSVDAADEVEFNGEIVSVEKLLSDEFMSDLMKKYVEAPEGSDFRKQIEAKEPQLAAWMREHEAALKEAALQLKTGFGQFDEIQGANKQTVDNLSVALGGNPNLASDLIHALFPDFKPGMSATKLDMSKAPGLDLLSDPAKMQAAGLDPAAAASNLKQLAETSPEAAASLMKMSPEELKQFGLGERDSPNFQRWMKYVQEWKAVSSLNPEDPESIVDYLFGPEQSLQSIQAAFTRELAAAKQTGQESAWLKSARDALDRDGDGRIDSGAQLTTNLKDMLGGGNPLKDPKSLNSVIAFGLDRARKLTHDSDFFSQLGPAAADGHITTEEVSSLSGLSTPSLKQLLANPGVSLDFGAKKMLTNEVAQRAVQEVADQAIQRSGVDMERVTNVAAGKYIPTPAEAGDLRRRLMDAWKEIEAEMQRQVDQSGGAVDRTTLLKYADQFRAAIAKMDSRYPQMRG